MTRGSIASFMLLLAACPAPTAGTGETGADSSSGELTTTGQTPTTSGEATSGGSSDTGEPASSSSESGASSEGSEGTTAAAEPVCGDGVIAGEELCDDGVESPDDGCDEQCKPRAVVLWTQSWDSGLKKDDDVSGLAVDGAGNIYLAGSSGGEGSKQDALIRKLDPDGKELLKFSFAGPNSLDDVARSVAVDAGGNIYASGFEWVTDKEVHGWVRKYDPAGKQLWVHERVSEVVDGDAVVSAVALHEGAVYAVGYENVGDIDTTQYFVQRLGAADGEAQWTEIVEGGAALYKLGLAVDPDGELLVGGSVRDAMDTLQPWIGKYGPDGALKWSNTEYLAGGGLVTGAAAGPGGELAVTGIAFQFNDNNVWVASLNPVGAVIWSDFINGDGQDAGNTVAFGAGGELYVGGYINVSKHMSDTLVRRYTPTGVPYWTDSYNDALDLYDGVSAVLVTPTMVVAAGSEYVLQHGSNQWIRAYAP